LVPILEVAKLIRVGFDIFEYSRVKLILSSELILI
jgi:hypothetical protein